MQAGDPGHVLELVGIGGVDDESPLAILAGKFLGDLAAQGSGVVAAAAFGVGQHGLVDLVSPAGAGVQTAAAAHKGVTAGQVYPLLGADGQNGVYPVIQLVGHRSVLGQIDSLMDHVLFKDLLVALEQGDLGGGRAGINCENLISHSKIPSKTLVTQIR